jgi:hypothetical protein
MDGTLKINMLKNTNTLTKSLSLLTCEIEILKLLYFLLFILISTSKYSDVIVGNDNFGDLQNQKCNGIYTGSSILVLFIK